jgi:hypothetical protein
MQEPKDLTPPGSDLPDRMRKLRPVAPPSNTAREIWYEAGYRAGRRSLNLWRTAAACAVIGAVALVALQRQPVGGITTPPAGIVQVSKPAPQRPSNDPAVTTADSSYARLRDSLIRQGLRGLEGPELPGGNPSTPPSNTANPELQSPYYTNMRG